MTAVVVYTAVCGDYFLEPIPPHADAGPVDWRAFRDADLPADAFAGDSEQSVRRSRLPKVLSHEYLPDAEWSVWHDASLQLVRPPAELVELVDAAGCDAGLFINRRRACLADEFAAVRASKWVRKGRADLNLLNSQETAYSGLTGLREPRNIRYGGVIVRRRYPAVEAFERLWFAEYCRWTCRDQPAMNFAVEQCGLRVFDLPGDVKGNSWFQWIKET